MRKEETMRTIMCAVDGSPGAAEAVRVAAALRQSLGLRLVLTHVADGYRLPDGPAGISGVKAQEGAERLLERVAREHGIDGDADRRAEVGDRVQELARVAHEEAAALIVVGARRQGRRGRRLLSGLATGLTGISSCPVVVVPPPARR
jgi:nucleotide-binding universal stress UspA family protein